LICGALRESQNIPYYSFIIDVLNFYKFKSHYETVELKDTKRTNKNVVNYTQYIAQLFLKLIKRERAKTYTKQITNYKQSAVINYSEN